MSAIDRVTKWRNDTKQRMIDSFNGKCGICGYNTCPEALDFHHLDPSKKEFSFGQVRASCVSWKKIVIELRKCVCVCSNCHREVHYNLLPIPENIVRYNEEFTDYKEKRRLEYYDLCPICNKTKLKRNVTCSLSCAAKLANRANYPSIDILKKEVDSMGYCAVGRKYKVSDNAIRKRIKKYYRTPT